MAEPCGRAADLSGARRAAALLPLGFAPGLRSAHRLCAVDQQRGGVEPARGCAIADDRSVDGGARRAAAQRKLRRPPAHQARRFGRARACRSRDTRDARPRSEEHTSELQSLMRISYAVFCLKKKTK